MEVTADNVSVSGAFVAIFAIISGTESNGCQRCRIAPEEGLPTMVFVADDITKVFAGRDDIADESLV